MDLKSILGGREEKNRELYWALVIEPSWIQAGIWEIVEKKAEVVSISPAAAWESEEEMVAAADTALSAAIQPLPEDSPEPAKTVFGVPSSWVTGGQIKEEYLAKIRKLCAELSLQPVGFVVIPEAIAHLVKSQEGASLNGVVVGVTNEELELSIFKLGTLAGTTQVARSVSIAEDVAEGLARFGGSEVLPSRMLIYDGKEGELEDLKQSLISTDWEDFEKVKFLHTPKVEVLDPDKKVVAVSLAGASEIASVVSVAMPKEEEFAQEEEKELENVQEPQEEVTAEDLGFVIGHDVGKPQPTLPAPPLAVNQTPGHVPAKPVLVKPKLKMDFALNFLRKARVFLSSLFGRKKISFQGLGTKPLIFAGFFLAFFLVAGFAWWWFYPKANVAVYVSSQRLNEKSSLKVSTTSGSDIGARILSGKILETEMFGDKSLATTGQKVVGEKAKGSVNIRNGTDSSLQLPAGTIIYGPGNLQFTLDQEASVSAQLSPGSPGSAVVAATAANIGPEYNLEKETRFQVSNYPQSVVDALSTATFSGGSSQEISSVSEDDQKKLEKELTDELLEKAQNKLSGQIEEGRFLVTGGMTTTVKSKEFSQKVGDEATNLKLSLTISASGVSVDKKELDEIAKAVFSQKIPSGYELVSDQTGAVFNFKKKDSQGYQFEVSFSGTLLPQVDTLEIIKKITGKGRVQVEGYLTAIPGFSRVEIKMDPNLPGRLGSLPRVQKNIKIQIVPER